MVDIWPQSYQIFGWIEKLKKKKTVIYLPWQTVSQIDWYSRRAFIKDATICIQSPRVIGLIPLQWYFHKFTYTQAISLMKTTKNQGIYLPTEITKK